jgi:type VI secretion system protein ImpH
MAPKSRAEIASVIQALADQPYRFDFFHAVRWLENGRADHPRVGESRRLQDDPVRFHQHVSLGFPPSALHSYREDGGSDQSLPSLWVNFLGLLGPGGPMPLSITEYVYNRVYNLGDRTLAAFLDIFNHRMISLFYRAWARGQQTVSHDRPDDDWFADYIGSFLGIGSKPFQRRDVLPDCLKLYYAGRLSCPTKNAEGLQAILEDHLGLPATIEEFAGQWVTLARHDRCQLGGSAPEVRLGETLILGARFWECQQKFRIRLGPMTYQDYMALIPGGASLSRVAAWVRFYLGDELGWEVQLVLHAQEVRPVCLGQQGRLGWSCWLHTECPPKDPDDLVLTPSVA